MMSSALTQTKPITFSVKSQVFDKTTPSLALQLCAKGPQEKLHSNKVGSNSPKFYVLYWVQMRAAGLAPRLKNCI